MSDKTYRVTYRGNEVVVLTGAGKFMQGTSGFVSEAAAREAAARGDFLVEGLDGAPPPAATPAAATSAPPPEAAKPAAASTPPVAAASPAPAEKKAEEKKPEEKPAEKPAAEKKAEEKPAEKKG